MFCSDFMRKFFFKNHFVYPLCPAETTFRRILGTRSVTTAKYSASVKSDLWPISTFHAYSNSANKHCHNSARTKLHCLTTECRLASKPLKGIIQQKHS